MNARWMDPETGTFLSVDPLVADYAEPQSHNAYSYARNNPVTHTDPTGMCVPYWDFGCPPNGEPGVETRTIYAGWGDNLGVPSGNVEAMPGSSTPFQDGEAQYDTLSGVDFEEMIVKGKATPASSSAPGNIEELVVKAQMSQSSFQGPGTQFSDPIEALLDAHAWVQSQPAEMLQQGEFAGEVNRVGPNAYTYDKPRYYPRSEGRNIVRSNTIYAFHSHRPRGGERPSGTDFRSVGNLQSQAIGALFTPTGAVRLFDQTVTPRAPLWGFIPLPDARINTYHTIVGEKYRGH